MSIVSTQWLADHLDDPDLKIIDIRGHVLPASEPPPHYFAHRADYDEAHIPGAVFVDWRTDITDPNSPNGKHVATPEAYALLMSRLGIGDGSFIVAYDDADGMFAARMWWTLRYYGHERAAVLDGGWPAWIAEGRPTTADLPTITPAIFTARPQPHLRRTGDQVAAALDDPNVTLIDVRSPQEYHGQSSRIPRKGRIPGALNLPRKSILGAAPDALRERISDAGVSSPDATLITYCNAGVSAAYVMFALTQAGYANVAVYDGSWKEWGADDSRPIEAS